MRNDPGADVIPATWAPAAWAHLCTVNAQRIDPVEVLGVLPDTPLPYWGWGDIPDQYRRRWDGDDGRLTLPADPGLARSTRSCPS